MADKSSGPNTKSKKRPLTYFFLNDQLHKKLVINRGRDLIETWNFAENTRKIYSYSYVLKAKKTAFTTKQVIKMLNRSRISLMLALADGMIERPAIGYTLDEKKNPTNYYWREKDVLGALEYFSSLSRGRPRKDGRQTPASDLPTPREVRAMMNNEEVLYVKQGDIFVPTWRAKEFR